MSVADDLPQQYSDRFSQLEDYRLSVWKTLTQEFFSTMIPQQSSVLDLGCGWGEFINNIEASQRYGMDLNADCPAHLSSEVRFLHQDCSTEWSLPDDSLDVIFTSNFFEHLNNKECLNRTLSQAIRCLTPGGKIICMGPNIKYLPGRYWDFYDHYLPLTELSLSEALRLRGFDVTQTIDRFLPYTMINRRPTHPLLIKLYLKLPLAWRFLGKQFLVVAQKPTATIS